MPQIDQSTYRDLGEKVAQGIVRVNSRWGSVWGLYEKMAFLGGVINARGEVRKYPGTHKNCIELNLSDVLATPLVASLLLDTIEDYLGHVVPGIKSYNKDLFILVIGTDCDKILSALREIWKDEDKFLPPEPQTTRISLLLQP